MPRGARLVVVALVVAVGFVAVVLPLFTSGGAPRAEIAGALPATLRAGEQARVDIAIDNTGDSIIYPVCVAVSGEGAHLVSADFQGLDLITATHNVACGGQLTGQETIAVTLVLRLTERGTSHLRMVPRQGASVIGPALAAQVEVS